jgi:hypothetical protein
MSHDYYRFLVRTISTAGRDPAQLRAIIYHYARGKLRRELWTRKDLHWAQMKEQLSALEKAIEQVEADIGDGTMFPKQYFPKQAATQPMYLPADTEARPTVPPLDTAAKNVFTRSDEAALPANEEAQPAIFPMDTAAQDGFAGSDEISHAADREAQPAAFRMDTAAQNDLSRSDAIVLPADTGTDPPIFPLDTAAQDGFARLDKTALAIRKDFMTLERAIQGIEPELYDRGVMVKTGFDSIQPIKPTHTFFWSTIRLALAVVLGVALFVTIQDRANLQRFFQAGYGESGGQPIVDGHNGTTAMHLAGNSPPAPVSVRAIESSPGLSLQAANIPVPTSYGVYAVSRGRLADLQTLPIRVPDERVGISALFSAPSETTLPDGRLQFVAFRRDLANNAPDRVMVRLVARVMRALTFDAKGHAKLVNVEASWGVRSNHYQMQVTPVNGNPEMVVIRPMNPNFVFPAGRYALVLQGSAYDFTVAGQITDTAQCLERTDALDMPVYSECRTL